MSEKWSQVKWRRRVRDSHERLGVSRIQAAAIASVITDQTSGKSRMMVSQKAIAEEAGVEVPTVRRFIQKAYDAKLICWIGRIRKGRGLMDVHELSMPDPNRPPMPKPKKYADAQRSNGAKGAARPASLEPAEESNQTSTEPAETRTYEEIVASLEPLPWLAKADQ